MDKVPRIYRPNAIASEDWAKLSREQQVQWWKDREPKTRAPSKPIRGIELYNTGIITKAELPCFVFERLTEENVQGFMDSCPPDIVFYLRDNVRRLPPDDYDEGWRQLISIGGVLYAPWVTEEEIRQSQEESSRRFREGVRLFRVHDKS